ncbi:hypothetical protein H261_15617 [Paramagnetospirillum caucaseum]|uniref:DSBA-like thioredoxin domain-containing protein n=1 Tax=Paramagnetospirillum caucaseum TaxID=1244869 RepID=M2Y7C2_9PROT|nr:DsbA family protein [Paramagnetospirillum caucaseum]EME68956.1 hypothetical protein H261_15617 [Paramagnetospirillum caucaseum]
MSPSPAKPIHLAYLFDPLCGWCYGAAPNLARLRARSDVEMELVPTGLFTGSGARSMTRDFADYAWDNDRRIFRLTGQVFSAAYHDQVLGSIGRPFDSGPAILALMAVRRTEPQREFEALSTLQKARYEDGRDTTSLDGVRSILAAQGFKAAAAALDHQPGHIAELAQSAISRGRALMAGVGAQGVPTLLILEDANATRIDTSTLISDLPRLLAIPD